MASSRTTPPEIITSGLPQTSLRSFSLFSDMNEIRRCSANIAMIGTTPYSSGIAGSDIGSAARFAISSVIARSNGCISLS